MTLGVVLAAFALLPLLPQEKPMSDEALKKDLAATWAEVRTAFDEYRLDDLKRLLDVPENAPTPTRAQAKQFAAFLPDLSKSRFLRLQRERDRVGYYAQTDLEKKDQTTITVIRYRKDGDRWRLVGAPDTVSSYSTDQKVDAAGIQKLSETQESLKLFPAESAAPAPPPEPKGEPQDKRPELEIRRELEATWRRIRDAFAAGKPETAADALLLAEGDALPPPDEARQLAKTRLPDLVRGQFLKLAWPAEKPHLVGYYAETNVGNAKKTTVALIVFVRKEGAWKFSPGPASISVVELPPTGRAALLKLIDTDPRLKF